MKLTVSSFITTIAVILVFGGLFATPLYVHWLESQSSIPFFIQYLWPVVITAFLIAGIVGVYQLHLFLQNQKSKHAVFLSLVLLLTICIGIVLSMYASYSGDIAECRRLDGEIHHKSYGMRPFIIQCLDAEGKNMFNVWYQER